MVMDVKTVLGSNFTGPQGVQGPSGSGSQGTTGIQGFTGIQGPSGTGSQGTTGAQGIQGTTGTGAQGATGAVGPRTISFLISGGGATITTGATEAAQTKGYIYTSQNLVIDSWTLLSNASGTIVVDIWTGTYSAFPTLVQASSSTQRPRLAAATKNTASNSGMTVTNILAGNVIQFRVNSVATVDVTDVTVVMNVIAS